MRDTGERRILLFCNGDGLRWPPLPASGHQRPGPAAAITAWARRSRCGLPAGRWPRPVDLSGGTLLPGFIDAHVHPVFAGDQLRRCDLSDATTRRGYLELIAAYARDQPRRRLDHRRRLVDGRLPRRHPAAADARRGRPRPPGVPAQPRRARRLGQQPRRCGWPGSTPRRPTRPTAGSSATPPASRSACCRRARRPGLPADPGHQRRGLVPGAAGRPGPPAVLRHHRLAGRNRRPRPWRGQTPCVAYLRAAQDGSLLANVVGALWWDRDRGLEQLPELLDRREHRARRGGSGADQREDDARRRGGEPHRRDARALPGRRRLRAPTHAGLDFIDPASSPALT